MRCDFLRAEGYSSCTFFVIPKQMISAADVKLDAATAAAIAHDNIGDVYRSEGESGC